MPANPVTLRDNDTRCHLIEWLSELEECGRLSRNGLLCDATGARARAFPALPGWCRATARQMAVNVLDALELALDDLHEEAHPVVCGLEDWISTQRKMHT